MGLRTPRGRTNANKIQTQSDPSWITSIFFWTVPSTAETCLSKGTGSALLFGKLQKKLKEYWEQGKETIQQTMGK